MSLSETRIYRVLIGERWTLQDLYTLPHAYLQNYAFTYCFDSELDPRNAQRINDALVGYPWRGGYSYVNIYTVLRHQVPKDERPVVASIQYASPGWLDLLLNPDVALQMAKSIGILSGVLVAAALTYKKLHKIVSDIDKQRRVARIEALQLSRMEVREIIDLSNLLAEHLAFNSYQLLVERTGNADVAAKLMMAHYRRMKTLAEFVDAGKANFPESLRDDG